MLFANQMKLLFIFIKLVFKIHLLLIIIRLISLISKLIFKKVNSADKIFKQNKWNNNYMFVCFNFNGNKNEFLNYLKKIKLRIDSWENEIYWYKKYKIKGIFDLNYNNNLTELINSLNISKPPIIDGKLLPYKIIFLYKTKQIVLLLNHYYCDGRILYEMVGSNILNTNSLVNFTNYNYIPFFYDFLLLKYLAKSVKNLIFKHNLENLKLSKNQSNILIKKIYYTGKINRWYALAQNINFVFKYVKLNSLKVAFTIGFNDNIEFCKNRIGIIILDVPKLNNIDEYTIFLKRELINNKYDALSSYDLIRNFPIDKIRNNFDSNIDIVLTSFKLDGSDINDKNSDLQHSDYNIGSFIGIGRIPIYICSMTLDYQKTIKICIKSTTPDFDFKNAIKNEENVENIYTWKN